MPRKKSTACPNNILGRAWELIALSMTTPITKVRKLPGGCCSSRKLFLFKFKRSLQLRHDNYAFINEYEFSPSSTPLFVRRHLIPSLLKKKKKKKTRFLSFLICGSNVGTESLVGDQYQLEVDLSVTAESDSELDEDEDGDGSVDLRAEKFIERFYEEMRINHRRKCL